MDVEVTAHLAGQLRRRDIGCKEFAAFLQECGRVLGQHQVDLFLVKVRLGLYHPTSLRDENARPDELVLERAAAVAVDRLGQLAVEAL